MESEVKWGKTLGLAASLLVLGSFAYWFEFSHKPKKEKSEEQAKKVLQLGEQSVDTLSLIDSKNTFVFQCAESDQKLCKTNSTPKWKVLKPANLEADSTNVNSLLSAITNATPKDTVDLDEETPDKRVKLLKDYELDEQTRKSARRVEIKLHDGKLLAVYLGSTHPIGDSIFSIAGEADKIDDKQVKKVSLLNAFLKTNWEKDLTYWRNKKLFETSTHEIQGFSLKSEKGTVAGNKKDGTWTISGTSANLKGTGLSGDAEAIETILTAVTHINAKTFVSEDKASAESKAALKPAKLTTEFTFTPTAKAPKAEEPIRLAFYEIKAKASPHSTEKLYLAVENQSPLYEIEKNSADKLKKSLAELRQAKLITSTERFSTKKIEISGGDLGNGKILLENKDGKWTQKDLPIEIDSNKVSALLDKLSGNRIKEFYSEGQIPKGKEKGLHVTISDEKDQKKKHLIFWKTSTLTAIDETSARKEAFSVDSTIQDALPSKLEFFKKEPKPAASGQPEKDASAGQSAIVKPKLPMPSMGNDHGNDHNHNDE